MQDKDLTKLPILDDIVVPGDTGKAADDRKDHSDGTAWKQDGVGTMGPSATGIEAGVDIDTAGIEAATGIENRDTAFARAAPDDTVLPANPAVDRDASPVTAGPAPKPGRAQQLPTNTAAAPLDIDTLADAILARAMPDLERLLREKIRQALAQHLRRKTDRG